LISSPRTNRSGGPTIRWPRAAGVVKQTPAACRRLGLLAIVAASVSAATLAARQTPQPPADPPPADLTAEQDHRRLMDLLGIASIRRGPSGNPQAPDAANFDESKANPYPSLPDPLVLKDGTPVKTAAAWWQKRRAEIVEDFDREIYGRVPARTPSVRWEVISTTGETNGDVPVVTKRLVGHVDNSAYPRITVDIELTLSTPAKAKAPVPVVMEFGFVFPGGRPPPGFPPPPPGPTWQQQVLAKGWGYAILIPTSVQADNGAGLTRGIIGLVNKGQPRKVDDWGALRAWAWGASRALDYLETDKTVDSRLVGIEGLSRYGKAALVTMAYDDRFAIGFIGSSGEGGAKLHRRNFGEQVENVAGSGEYHWVAGNFIKYAGPLNAGDLPVDSHELIALCAPRPVFISVGSPQVEGGWVDAKGMFLAAVGAGPVYKLLGKKDLGTTEYPPIETALIDGDVAFRQHSGGHSTLPNWPTFLAFADRYIKALRVTAATPPAAVALTFDDLPSHGPLPRGVSRVDVAKSIIDSLRRHKAPAAYGFINAKAVTDRAEDVEVLKEWRAAGLPLGNHAYSHMDLHANDSAAFEQDVLGNESTLQSLMGGDDWHWFRYPFLHEGDTADKHRAVLAFLTERHYKVAQVTLSFDDYAYNEPYARCLAKNDTASIDWLKHSFLSRADDSLTRGRDTARQLFGRDIKHVMVLHIGGFQTVMLSPLLDLLAQRGFTLTTLEDAQADAAYATPPDLDANWNGTLLDQLMRAHHLTPAPGEPVFEKLASLCR
jgi:peptidoglycan/xylan/chitin deacetylase (PgdA/CDA1 family)